MEGDATTAITFYLKIPSIHKRHLGTIRHWAFLKIGFDNTDTWLKGFTETEIRSVEVKAIMAKELFYEKKGQLFKLDSLLPSASVPSVLWSTIDRGLPLEIAQFNHNYFGIEERVQPRLVRSDREEQTEVLKTTLAELESYLDTASSIRLKSIEWLIVNETEVWLWGTPMLPIRGETFWRQNHCIVPAGYDLQITNLYAAINETINSDNDHWIIFREDGRYFTLRKSHVKPLTLGSFRLTLKQLLATNNPQI